MILPITLTAAALAALINFWLSMRIGRVRIKEKILVGDGGNDVMIRRMRAQANFIEFTPIILVLIGAVELAIGTPTWLWVVMLVYMVARVCHGLGMDGNMRLREIGIIVTMLTMVGLAGYGLYLAHFTTGQITEMPADIVPAG